MPNYTYGFDVSAYNPIPDYAAMDTKGVHVDFVIVKGCQNTTEAHVKAARNAGKITALYFWHDPIQSPSYQLGRFVNDIEKFKPDFIVLDIEQYWKDWNQYTAYLQGKLAQKSMKVFTSKEISNSALAVMKGLAPYGKLAAYTAPWFINSWSPDMLAWLPNYDYFGAQYVDYGKAVYKATAEQFTGILNGKTMSLPKGVKTWKLWQYSSRMILPTTSAPLDCDVFNGTLDELKAWCGIKTAPVQEIQQPETGVGLSEWAKSLDAWARSQGFAGPNLKA